MWDVPHAEKVLFTGQGWLPVTESVQCCRTRLETRSDTAVWGLSIAGVLEIGPENLTPFPKPREGGELTTTGVYGKLHHFPQ